MSQQLKAGLMLLLIPILWGITFPLMHIILANLSANFFVFWRFLCAGILLLPIWFYAWRKKSLTIRDLRYGILIALTNSGGYVFQGMALQHEDSARAAFVTGVNVILVPLLLPLFGMRRPRVLEIVAAIICLGGIYIISGANFDHVSYGDLLVFCSAIFIALGIILVERASSKSSNLQLLVFYQIIFTPVIPFLILKGNVFNFPHNMPLFWFAVIYCALIATVVAIFLQLKYQSIVGSSKAAIIFNFEAIAASFAAWMMGESISENVLIGGIVIVFSAVLTDLYKLLKNLQLNI